MPRGSIPHYKQWGIDWGKPRWKGSRTFRRLFRKKGIPEDRWKYIDEMKLHVFEMRHLPEGTRKLFKSDMRIIVDFLAEGKDYRSDRKIVHKAALIRMVKVLSGDMDVGGVEKWMEEQGVREEDEVKVCELFDQYERRGRMQGREEGEKIGIEKGKKLGIAEGEKLGMVKGEAKGEAKGESRFAKLVQMLMDSGRNDDVRRVAIDPNYRKQLYMEAKLV